MHLDQNAAVACTGAACDMEESLATGNATLQAATVISSSVQPTRCNNHNQQCSITCASSMIYKHAEPVLPLQQGLL